MRTRLRKSFLISYFFLNYFCCTFVMSKGTNVLNHCLFRLNINYYFYLVIRNFILSL